MSLLETALTFWGTSEIGGCQTNPKIGAFLNSVGLSATDETSWCSAFLYYCALSTHMETPPKGLAPSAKSWLRVGQAVTAPLIGDVVILRRGDPSGWQGHVGLYIAPADTGSFYLLGGNQRNTVSIEHFLSAQVLGFRRLGVLGDS